MQLGLLTAPFEDTPLIDVARWAVANGYTQLEVASWPSASGDRRRYAGTAHLPIEDMTRDRAQQITGELAEAGVTISGLAYYPNNLDPDDATREAAGEHTKAVIRAAALLEVPVVNTFVGADQRLPVDANYERALEVLPPIVAEAREHGIKLAIENCPMIFSLDEWPAGKNIAYSPHVWRRLFEDFDETLGLNLDPSHLIWLMIDVSRVVREFADRIYHVHIKDLAIDREGLYEHGVLSGGIGWAVPRLPGLGDVDWRRFVADLYRVGYDGVLCVEHEDRDFEGADELLKRGFLIARNHIAPLIG